MRLYPVIECRLPTEALICVFDLIMSAHFSHPPILLSKRHIQHHHDCKSCRKQDGPHIGVLPFRHFRDQLLHHHIDHGPGRKAQKIRQERDHKSRRKYGQRRAHQLYRTGKRTIKNAFPLLTPSARRGMEMIAPSGKFCIAIPRESASAPMAVIPASPESHPA